MVPSSIANQVIDSKYCLEEKNSPQKSKSSCKKESGKKIRPIENLKKRLNRVEEGCTDCSQCRKKDKKLRVVQIQLEAVLSEIKQIKKEFFQCNEQIELISANFSFILELASENIEKKVDCCFDEIYKNAVTKQEKTQKIEQLISQKETSKTQILYLQGMVHHFKQKYLDIMIINKKIESQLASTAQKTISSENPCVFGQRKQELDTERILSKAAQLRKKFSNGNHNYDISPPNERIQFKSLKERLNNLKNWINKESQLP